MTRKTKKTVSSTSGMIRPDYSVIKEDVSDFETRFRNALYFVHYDIKSKTLKKETMKWVKNNTEKDHKEIEILEDGWFASAGKFCYLMNKGVDVPEKYKDGIDRLINNVFDHAERKRKIREREKELNPFENTTKEKTKPNIQDRIKDQAAEAASEFDECIDRFLEDRDDSVFKKVNPLNHMKGCNLKQVHVRHVKSFYRNDIDELSEYLSKKPSEDIKEGYSHFKKTEAKKLLKFLQKIYESAEMVEKLTKAKRKPRKKKKVDKTKKVDKIKYLREYEKYKLVSINPIDIIGAKELWVFNTKTRKIGRILSLDESGLDIKGTTVKNMNEKDSIQKTLRKPEEQLKEFYKKRKNQLNKYMDEIATVDTKMKGRLNEHCILLKVL